MVSLVYQCKGYGDKTNTRIYIYRKKKHNTGAGYGTFWENLLTAWLESPSSGISKVKR